ncbi:hypothetical protein B0T25DRAFT_275997 [Lasiosphaeria hispida]|uniref:Uncharacterized protein n=1 Tax=Lasiosphaeria hispida TaxID=260671 RepID=A0AAJ0HB09_9PEZI|nr:hypothetical protein B0T25DRAFT_275997 [Lasiosphaeria hispida]
MPNTLTSDEPALLPFLLEAPFRSRGTNEAECLAYPAGRTACARFMSVRRPGTFDMCILMSCIYGFTSRRGAVRPSNLLAEAWNFMLDTMPHCETYPSHSCRSLRVYNTALVCATRRYFYPFVSFCFNSAAPRISSARQSSRKTPSHTYSKATPFPFEPHAKDPGEPTRQQTNSTPWRRVSVPVIRVVLLRPSALPSRGTEEPEGNHARLPSRLRLIKLSTTAASRKEQGL